MYRPRPRQQRERRKERKEKPAPFLWRSSAFAGVFGDPFIKDTSLEGGLTEVAIEVLVAVISSKLPGLLRGGLFPELEGRLDEVLSICDEFTDAAKWSREMPMRRPADFAAFLGRWVDRLERLRPGERFLWCGGWSNDGSGHAIMHMVERDRDYQYAFVTANTGEGVNYHPKVQEAYPKDKHRCCIRIRGIPASRFPDEGVWFLFHAIRCFTDDGHIPQMLYEVILPHLAGDRALSAAVEDCDPGTGDGTNGPWETVQRSGTCHYRCVNSLFKYCLFRAGWPAALRKQFTLAVRVAFLEVCADELSSAITDFQDNDLRMLSMACLQASRAAGKEFRKENITEEALRHLHTLVSTVTAAARTTPIAGRAPADTISISRSLSARAGPASAVTPRPFGGMHMIAAGGDTAPLAGDVTVASPDMFVDLKSSAGGALAPHHWTLQRVCVHIAECRDRCDRLMRKTSASAVSVALYQIRALVEDEFADVLPIPKALVGDEKAIVERGGMAQANPDSCPFRRAITDPGQRVSLAAQRAALADLSSVMAFYMAACFSCASDAAADTARQVIAAAIMCIGDALARVPCPGEGGACGLLCQALVGECGRQDENSGFWPPMKSFSGVPLANLAGRHVAYEPRILLARDRALRYLTLSAGSGEMLNVVEFEQSSNSNGSSYFGLPTANFSLPYDANSRDRDATLVLVGAMLAEVNMTMTLPKMATASRTHSPGSSTDPTEASAAERFTRWLCTSEWPECPEFAAYRDLCFHYRLAMEHLVSLRTNNSFPRLFTPEKISPYWQYWHISRAQGRAGMRLVIGEQDRGTTYKSELPPSPTSLARFVSAGVSNSKEGKAAFAPGLMRSRSMEMRDQEQIFRAFMMQLVESLPEGEREQARGELRETSLEQLINDLYSSGMPPELIQMLCNEETMSLRPVLPWTSEGRVPAPSEDDVLFTENPHNFGNTLGEEEAERFLTFLSAPAIAIPLTLNFFADGRASALCTQDVQELLESLLFEAKEHSYGSALSDVVPQPRQSRPHALATRLGLLLEELLRMPAGVFRPLQKIGSDVAALAIGNYDSAFARLLQFVARIMVRVEAMYAYVEANPIIMLDVVGPRIAVHPRHMKEHADAKALRQRMRGWLDTVVRPLLINWLRQSEAADDVRASTAIHAHLALIAANSVVAFAGRTTLTDSSSLLRNSGFGASQDPVPDTRAVASLVGSAAFVVSWHTKSDALSAGGLRKAPAAVQPRTWYSSIPATTAESPVSADAHGGKGLLAEPVADVFGAIQRTRGSLLRWVDGCVAAGDKTALDVALGTMVSVALQREAPPHLRDGDASDGAGAERGSIEAEVNVAYRGWMAVGETPLNCEYTIESEHPYLPTQDFYETVSFPGAPYVVLNFDTRCATEERDGEIHDYVTIFKDSTLTDYHGEHKKIGGARGGGRWAGSNGTPPLIVPANHFVLHFHSDSSIEDWGYRVVAYAPVDMERARSLLPLLDGPLGAALSAEDRMTICQRVCAACRNEVATSPERALPPVPMEGRAYLARNAERLLQELAEEKAEAEALRESGDKRTNGLFVDPSGAVQVNLQTCEVYLGKRVLMPTPPDIQAHADFSLAFGDETPFCALKEGRTERRVISIVDGSHTYTVEAWKPLLAKEGSRPPPGKDKAKAPGERGGARRARPADAGFRGSVEHDRNLGGLPEQACFGMPRRRAVGLDFRGEAYSRRYRSGDFLGTSAAWISELFDPLFADAIDAAALDEVPLLWIPDAVNAAVAAGSSVAAAALLMYVPPSGSAEERRGHPGAFFEVELRNDFLPIATVFHLEEHGRVLQRVCVACSDTRYCLHELAEDTEARQAPWARDGRHAGGCMWSPIMDKMGKLRPAPGSGDLVASKVGSLRIKRSRVRSNAETLRRLQREAAASGWGLDEGWGAGDAAAAAAAADEWGMAVLVPPRFVSGLLPACLAERYVFWRSGPRMLRGYAKDPADATHIRVHLLPDGEGKGLGSDTEAKVYRDHCPAVLPPELFGDDEAARRRTLAAMPASLLLLNLAGAGRHSTVGRIARTLVRLDNLSHCLCWSRGDPEDARDECEVALIELTRLELRFEARAADGDGFGLRLHSLDHANKYIAEGVDPASPVGRMCASLPHGVVLSDPLGHHCLLVPNFALFRVDIHDCPLNGEVGLMRDYGEWRSSVRTTHYIYEAHLSGAYLNSPGLSASVYLVALRLMQREYLEACKALSGCFSDSPFSGEERWALRQAGKTVEDKHPDAVAIRCKLALITIASGTELPWELEKDVREYYPRQAHTHAFCRLSLEEERAILDHVAGGGSSRGPAGADPRRREYLKAVEEAGMEGAEQDVAIEFSGSPCQVGGDLISGWMRHLTQFVSPPRWPSMLFDSLMRYERPDETKISGGAAVTLLRGVLDDALDGSQHSTGFALLFEMLTGVVSFDVSGRLGAGRSSPMSGRGQLQAPTAMPESVVTRCEQLAKRRNDARAQRYRYSFGFFGRPRPTTDEELPREPRYAVRDEAPRGHQGSVVLAKMLMQAFIVKVTQGGQQGMPVLDAEYLSVLVPVAHAVENRAALFPLAESADADATEEAARAARVPTTCLARAESIGIPRAMFVDAWVIAREQQDPPGEGRQDLEEDVMLLAIQLCAEARVPGWVCNPHTGAWSQQRRPSSAVPGNQAPEEPLASAAGIFPALPYRVCQGPLRDGVEPSGPLLAFLLWCFQQANAYATRNRPERSSAEDLSPFEATLRDRVVTPMLYESTLMVPVGAELAPRRPFSDTSRQERTIAGGEGQSAMSVDAEELFALTSRPLLGIPGVAKAVLFRERTSDESSAPPLGDLPFTLDGVEGMDTPAAAAVIDRMRTDLRSSAARIAGEKVPQLSFLDDKNLATLDGELVRLRERASEAAAADAVCGSAGDAPDGGAMTVATKGRSHSRQLSANELIILSPMLSKEDSRGSISERGGDVLLDALRELDSLIAVLDTVREADEKLVAEGIEAVEELANGLGAPEEELDAPRLTFALSRGSGNELRPWFALLAAAPMAQDAEAQLRRMNPFLSAAGAEKVLEGIQIVQLRVVRVAQTQQCLREARSLRRDCRALVERRLRVQWDQRLAAGRLSGARPSADMIASALEKGDYDEERGKGVLLQYLDMEAALFDGLSSGALVPEARVMPRLACHGLARTALQAAGFDRDAAATLLRETGLSLFRLMRRRCCYGGSPLTAVAPEELSSGAGGEGSTPQGDEETAALLPALVHVIRHAAGSLAASLAASRHYMHYMPGPERKAKASFDPRFCVFEYVSGFMLRRRQVSLVKDFVDDARHSRSRVEQMLMGQGKTTVVGPLLAIMLADARHLVTVVVPSALIDMSRGVLRSVFSSVIPRRVYTLRFDRGSPAAKSPEAARALYAKLRLAREQRCVVCADPSSVKAILLKYLDLLQAVRQAPPMLFLQKEDIGSVRLAKYKAFAEDLRRCAETADVLRDILGLFREGYGLLDEIDLLLHPLKSELNFPIGEREPLDLREGLRVPLALHMLDLLFFAQDMGVCMDVRADEIARQALREFKSAVQGGYKTAALQPKPHLVLLRGDYYNEHMKRPAAQWGLAWLRAHKPVTADLERCFGSDAASGWTQVLHYILGGGAAGTAERTQAERALGDFSPEGFAALNLCADFLSVYLPHVAGKVCRVSYGLLQPADLERLRRASGEDVQQSSSRMLLAVPFAGKDAPTRSSEFAHPEMQVCLSILAYRYEGLRESDMRAVVDSLKVEMGDQRGPFSERPARVLFQDWLEDAGVVGDLDELDDDDALGADGGEEELADDNLASGVVLPLELFQPRDVSQMDALTAALAQSAKVGAHYLTKHVFPKVLNFQTRKLAASGVDLGSTAVFQTRLGFSGTPSLLLPTDMGACNFEPGSEAAMVRSLTDPSVVTFESLPKNWSVDTLLDTVAKDERFSALIDTGALVTGYTNEEVARRLLALGLRHKDAVVFLDNEGRKMVVDRSGAPPIAIDRSGVSLRRRFVFYDQVSTTGMDIRHDPAAKAALTLGKDMVFRDYTQGAWRMRGLGKGQTVHVLLVSQILSLVQRTSDTGELCYDIVAWLVANGVRSERVQHLALAKQQLASTWRKEALLSLLTSSMPAQERGSSVLFTSRFADPVPDQERQLVIDRYIDITEEERETQELQMRQEIAVSRTTYLLGQLSSFVASEEIEAFLTEEGIVVSDTPPYDSTNPEALNEALLRFGVAIGVELDWDRPSHAEQVSLFVRFERLKVRMEAEMGSEALEDTTREALGNTVALRVQLRILTAIAEEMGIPVPAEDAVSSEDDESSAPDYAVGDGDSVGSGEDGEDQDDGASDDAPISPRLSQQSSVHLEASEMLNAVHTASRRRVSSSQEVLATIVPPAHDTKEWLAACMDVFLEALELHVERSVPLQDSFSESLARMLERRTGLLAGGPLADAERIIDRQRAEEAELGRSRGDATAMSLGAEIVQEQEQEQEQREEKEIEVRNRIAYDKEGPALTPWRLGMLHSAREGARGGAVAAGAFYPARSFRPAANAQPLAALPPSLLFSEQFASSICREDRPRRMRNVEALLFWRPGDEEKATVRCVLLSLAEAETLRRQLLACCGCPEAASGATASILQLDGSPLTLPFDAEGACFCDLQSSLCSAPLPIADPSSRPSVPEVLSVCRYLNNDMWFAEDQVVHLLRALRGAAESQRRAYFEALLLCRRRDRVDWQDTGIAQVFSHADETALQRLNAMAEGVRRLVQRESRGALHDVFRAWDTDGDRWLSEAELVAAVQRGDTGMDAHDVRELMLHFGADGDGFLDYREFAQHFGPQEGDGLGAAGRGARRAMRLAARQKRLYRMRRRRKGEGNALAQLRPRGASGQSADLGAAQPSRPPPSTAATLDWRRLASVGTLFLASGGTVLQRGDRLLSTRLGYLPTVSPRGVAITSGTFYFEVSAVRAGRAAIGWHDADFSPSSVKAVGMGATAHSWAYDALEGRPYHGGEPSGERSGLPWAPGDIIGCALDMEGADDGGDADERGSRAVRARISFYFNGERIDGVAFDGVRPAGNLLVPAVSFESSAIVSINFGEEPFRYAPPTKRHRSVRHWVRRLQEEKHARAAGPRYGTLQCTTGSTELVIDGMTLTVVDGFPSATLAGCLLTTGKWYYEFEVTRAGVAQVGFADLEFVGSNRDGLGVGDDKHSWGYDGARAPNNGLWMNGGKRFGKPWNTGTVIGVAADIDNRTMRFSHDGSWDAPMGTAVQNFDFVAGLIPGFTLNPSSLTANFGKEAFRYGPPSGYRSVQSWIDERRVLFGIGGGDDPAGGDRADAPAAGAAAEPAQAVAPGARDGNRQAAVVGAEARGGSDEGMAASRSGCATGEDESDDEPSARPRLATTVSMRTPPPERERSLIPIFPSSGMKPSVIEDRGDGEYVLGATAHFPSFKGDIRLTSGRWYFEVVLTAKDQAASAPRRRQAAQQRTARDAEAVIGFADKAFFGNYFRGQGVGADGNSWGAAVDPRRGLSGWQLHAGERWSAAPLRDGGAAGEADGGASEMKEAATVQQVCGCAIDVEARTIYFGANGAWEEAFDDIEIDSHLSPAISLSPAVTATVNLGTEMVYGGPTLAAQAGQRSAEEPFKPIGLALHRQPQHLAEKSTERATERGFVARFKAAGRMILRKQHET